MSRIILQEQMEMQIDAHGYLMYHLKRLQKIDNINVIKHKSYVHP